MPYELTNDFDEVSELMSDTSSIIEDDVVIEENEDERTNHIRQKRRVIRTEQYGIPTRWPNNTIPYKFDYDASI